MDAIQFGRWLSNRRRRCGWSSQRALAEATQQDPFFSACDISEKFLARLEAGHLVHPFRGAVRQRVLALAALVCTTPREVQTYLRAAELTALGAEEAAYVQRLHASLQAQRADPVMLLPPRPTRLVGRVELVDDLLRHLATGNSGLYAVTGMPGVGKSALAFEVMHRVLADDRQRRRLFPHRVAIFTCTGRRDTQGLVALLHEIGEAFPAAMKLACWSAVQRARKRRRRVSMEQAAWETLPVRCSSRVAMCRHQPCWPTISPLRRSSQNLPWTCLPHCVAARSLRSNEPTRSGSVRQWAICRWPSKRQRARSPPKGSLSPCWLPAWSKTRSTAHWTGSARSVLDWHRRWTPWIRSCSSASCYFPRSVPVLSDWMA